MAATKSPVLEFDEALIRRYDQSGPRYTSYPTAVQFDETFDANTYRDRARATNVGEDARPLSLYFHIPFCDTVCFYCACNKIVTKNRKRAVPYLAHLYREIAAQSELFDQDRVVDQLHWGGGTPTFLSSEQMKELMRVTADHFQLRSDDTGEYSIEVDPREADDETMAVLREIGFNRLSLGVQDFEPDVQKAVNRIQTEEQTLRVMDAARRVGFKSISVDLIYGLPLQNSNTFARTIERVIDADPDRLSIFNYAHLPGRFKTQRQINADQLPPASEKLAILRQTIARLTDAGYLYIGMDHFAKPDDELAIAQRERKLYRNFQGYSTHADCDLIAMGVTGIGSVGNTYSQNVRTVDEYYEVLDAGDLPVFRGIELNDDDLVRRYVISELICHFFLHAQDVETRFDIDFKTYFAPEIEALEKMAADALLTINEDSIEILPKGRLLIRSVCMVFDYYLNQKHQTHTFSKVI